MSIEHLKAICRFKKLSKEEKKEVAIWNLDLQNKKVSIGSESFLFNELFDESSKQEEIYEKVGKPAFYEFMEGYDTSILTYGKIGTGKTFTMIGSDEVRKFFFEKEEVLPLSLDKSAGLIPRLCYEVINQTNNLRKLGNECVLRVSYIENYLNNINCLISGRKNIFKGWGFKDSIKYKDDQEPREVVCKTVSDIFSVLCKGQKNAKICSTKENGDSSRSHTFLIFDLEILYLDGSKTNQKMFLVDMAGSERAYDYESDPNHITENKKINQSLFVLKSLVRNLAKGEKVTNMFYKQSILTGLLKNSIGGSAKTYIIVCANKKKDIGRKHVLNDNILTLRFGVEACKIKNKVEKRFVFDEEEYRMIIDELKDQVKILRGALKKNGFNYDFIKAESILLKILKNDEFAPIEEILKETRKIRKRNEYLEDSSDETFSNYDSQSSYESENEEENKKRNSRKKENENKKLSFAEEITNKNDNNNINNTVGIPGSPKKRKTKFLKFVEETTNENILACDPGELTINYQELERKYKKLVEMAGNKIYNMENRRITIKRETDQIFEDIKQEAVENLNQIIETKSREISNLNEKIEELKIQIIKKETELNKKLLDAQKENNNIKFNCKKLEIENNSLNEFINTYQSDILLLQSKIEKKRKKIHLLKETIEQLKADKEKVLCQNQQLKNENSENQEKIINMNKNLEDIKLELENTKYDKQNLQSIYESALNIERNNKEKINLLKTEKSDFQAKLKENKNLISSMQQKLEILEAQTQNSNDFICKFCKNRQSLEEPEHVLINDKQICDLKSVIEELENSLKAKNEEFEAFKMEMKSDSEDFERRIKNETSKYENLKIKYDELVNKESSNEKLIVNYKNKEKENEQLIASLKVDISRKAKEQERIEDENLSFKAKIENIETEVYSLNEKNSLSIAKIKEEAENEKNNFENEIAILKTTLEKKTKEIDDWETQYKQAKDILEKSENTKNDLELKLAGLQIEKKINLKRDTIMFMTDNKENKLNALKEELIDQNDKFKSFFNVKLKKVDKQNVLPGKARQNSGLNVKALLKKQGNNKFLIEAKEQQQKNIERTLEMIEQSENKEELLNLKKNIVYNVDDCESFESDGSLIFPDVDDYSDLEQYNKKLGDFQEKKKAYNVQKKIHFAKHMNDDNFSDF